MDYVAGLRPNVVGRRVLPSVVRSTLVGDRKKPAHERDPLDIPQVDQIHSDQSRVCPGGAIDGLGIDDEAVKVSISVVSGREIRVQTGPTLPVNKRALTRRVVQVVRRRDSRCTAPA